jgi:hypothetical protein
MRHQLGGRRPGGRAFLMEKKCHLASYFFIWTGAASAEQAHEQKAHRKNYTCYHLEMQSGWSVGVLMIAMGVLSVGGFGAQHPPTHVGWGIALILVGAGGLLFLRKPFVWWIGLGAALLTLGSGFVTQAGKTEWGLPVPPLLAIVIGLYLVLRLAMARAYFNRQEKREDQT